MDDFKYIRISEEQKNHYAMIVLNVSYAAYCGGDFEFASHLMGMCEDCLEKYFEQLGLVGDPNFKIDMDDDGKVFAYHSLEDEHDCEIDDVDLAERIRFSA